MSALDDALKFMDRRAVWLPTGEDLYDVACQELAALRRERDLAIAHDRQPYPTAEAYEKLAAALNKLRIESEKLREHLQHIRRWALQSQSSLTPRQVGDAVARMVDDVFDDPHQEMSETEWKRATMGDWSARKP